MSSELRVERPRELRLAGTKPRVTFNETVASTSGTQTVVTHSPRKVRLQSETRGKRKRTYSGGPTWDKRKRHDVPNKFLLGGSSSDPLNLEAVKLTEESSVKLSRPRPQSNRDGGGPIKVIIPPNINDPLNLDACSEDGDDQLANAIHRQRRRRKNRPHRKRRNSEPTTVITDSDEDNPLSVSFDEDFCQRTSNVEAAGSPCKKPATLRQVSCPVVPAERTSEQFSSQTLKPPCPKRQKSINDKIVSPVVPQRNIDRKKHQQPQKVLAPGKLPQEDVQTPSSYNPRNVVYQYGNYHQYYGYRNPDHAIDPRLKFFSREWIEGKDVLDIGCNIGHISLTLARDFQPRKVIGIDIDKKLINIARKNVRHYFHQGTPDEASFPASMRLLYGPIERSVDENGCRSFPHNVKFYQSNYVLEADELLETVKEEFDTIVCLSITKWIHLNWGDDGLKRFFHRIYRNLKAGGMLILEPQGWPSYKKKRKLTEEIFNNFKNIRLFPDSFEDYLTKEVGFYSINRTSVNNNFSKGFTRPLYIFRKPSESRRSSPKDLTSDKVEKPSILKQSTQNAPVSETTTSDTSSEQPDSVQNTKSSDTSCVSQVTESENKDSALEDVEPESKSTSSETVKPDSQEESTPESVTIPLTPTESSPKCEDLPESSKKLEPASTTVIVEKSPDPVEPPTSVEGAKLPAAPITSTEHQTTKRRLSEDETELHKKIKLDTK